MNLISNSVQPNSVREETRDGDRYLVVESVPFIREMELAGGWVPQEEIRSNTQNWNGKPLTVQHPTNDPNKPWYSPNHPVYGDGDYVPVDFHPLIEEQLVVGNAENPSFDGTHSRVDMAINADKANELGGHAADIVEKVENGKAFNVSSQYAPKQLEPQQIQGKLRSNVEGIDKADSIALLPHSPGQCSLERGECGINPKGVTANLRVPMADDGGTPEDLGASETMQGNQLEEARTPNFDGTTTGEWSKPDFNEYVEAFGFEDVSEVDDLTEEQAERIANTTLLGDPEADNFGTLQFFPVVEPGSMNLSENALMAVLSGRGAQADISESALESARSVARNLLEEEFNRDMSGNSAFNRVIDGLKAAFGVSGNETTGAESPAETVETPKEDPRDTTMSKKTAELVANHGFKEENLPEEDTECFTRIYDAVTSNETEEEEEEQTANDEFVTEDDLAEFKDTLVDELTESISANQQDSQKDELASEIVANSAEYEEKEEVIEDFPTEKALEAKRDSLYSGSATPGMGAGLSANTDDVDLEDISSGVSE